MRAPFTAYRSQRCSFIPPVSIECSSMVYTFRPHTGYVQYYHYHYSYIIMYLYIRIQTFKICFSWHDSSQWVRPTSLSRLQDHTQTPQSVGLHWNSDQSHAETSTCQHTTLTRNSIHAPGGIRTHNPSKRAAADPCIRPRGLWDQHLKFVLF